MLTWGQIRKMWRASTNHDLNKLQSHLQTMQLVKRLSKEWSRTLFKLEASEQSFSAGQQQRQLLEIVLMVLICRVSCQPLQQPISEVLISKSDQEARKCLPRYKLSSENSKPKVDILFLQNRLPTLNNLTSK
jgi:hypothetical protein